MAVVHGLLVLLALVSLVCLPCLVVMVITADEAVTAVVRAIGRGLRWSAARCGRTPPGRWLVPRVRRVRPATVPAGPPIEQIAADLRRLGGQRFTLATRSPVWYAAVQHAYDDRLSLACRELRIPEYLRELTGVDLEIERVRVEGMLQAAGLGLPGGDPDRRQDQH